MDKYSLKTILVYNGFLDAAENVHAFARNWDSNRISDVIELWKQWANEDKWPWDADKSSQKDWYKKFQEGELRNF